MNKRRKVKTLADTRPADFLAIADELGLRCVCYLNEAVECLDGTCRWLPRDLIGVDGKTLVIFRHADRDYAIDGWAPWHDGMFGGRYNSISAALNWVRIAKGVRAGTIQDFMGA